MNHSSPLDRTLAEVKALRGRVTGGTGEARR